MTLPRTAEVRTEWASRGFSFELWSDPPGRVWSDFVHDVDEVAMLLEGKIEFTIGKDTLRPAIGEELLIPAGVRHTVVNVGSTPNRWCFGYRHRP